MAGSFRHPLVPERFPHSHHFPDDVEELTPPSIRSARSAKSHRPVPHTKHSPERRLRIDPSLFTNDTVAPGTIGNAPRSICCGPGINNWDMSFSKTNQVWREMADGVPSRRLQRLEPRPVHTVDGNISNLGGTFGSTARPRSRAAPVRAEVSLLAISWQI